MANRWGKMKTVTDFIFLGSKITVDGDCNHEIKRCLLLGRKVMTDLDSVLKRRNITLPTKFCIVKAVVFPVVMYGCEKAEHWRIGAFEMWCWRRLLRVPWTARRLSQSILKEINSEYSLEGLRLELKLQFLATWYEELTHWKRSQCWERLRAGGEGSGRGWDGWMVSLTQCTWVWANSGRWWGAGKPRVLQSMGLQRVSHLGISFQMREISVLQEHPQIPSLPMLGKPCPPALQVIRPEIPKVQSAGSKVLSNWQNLEIIL